MLKIDRRGGGCVVQKVYIRKILDFGHTSVRPSCLSQQCPLSHPVLAPVAIGQF